MAGKRWGRRGKRWGRRQGKRWGRLQGRLEGLEGVCWRDSAMDVKHGRPHVHAASRHTPHACAPRAQLRCRCREY